METKVMNLGSSIAVPCVQELVKEPLPCIPPRYLRPELEETSIFNGVSAQEIPVIDMQRLLSADSMDSELDKLHFACQDWGFFQLVNHGVRYSLIEKVKEEVQEFFNLPMEKKRKYWQMEGDIEGFGQTVVVSDEQKLDWGDRFYMVTQPHHLRKPHLFPMLPLPFRETVEAYSLELKSVAMKIISKMGEALSIKAEEMGEFFEDGIQAMRMNYYPPCPHPQKVIGLTPHSDSIGLTILLQVNEVEGLQVKKDGIWIPVKPLPNAFIINIGDILEIITNGRYTSIEHRATVNSEKERVSIATFYSPMYGVEIGPTSSLVTPQTPPLFKRIGIVEYFKGLFSRKLDGKSYLDSLRL